MLARDKNKPLLDETETVDEAITSRRSVRAFLPDPVDESDDPRDPGHRVLGALRHQHAAMARLRHDRRHQGARFARHPRIPACAPKRRGANTNIIPTSSSSPIYARRRAVGFALYGHLGIGKRDVDQMRAQHDRNFVFFDAPVGMIFTIDRRLNQGSWVDYGMFLQNIMVAARARGLHTCPQAAFAPYHQQIRPVLEIPDEEIVVCGMALGYEDTSKPENNLRTERAPMDEWASFLK